MKIILILVLLAFGLAKAAEWSYENPSSWSSSYPLCGGKQQTPINIITSETAACGTSTLNVAYLNDGIRAVTVNI
jgi:carbonic anhydrase